MNFLPVTFILIQGLSQKGWQIFISNDVLKGGDVEPSGSLEDVLIAPILMLFFNSFCQNIVPAVKQDCKSKESRVLIGPDMEKFRFF